MEKPRKEENISQLQMKQRRSKRVLVVEDDKDDQEILSEVLSSMGFEVSLAKNGLEGLAVFVTDFFDLVLTDLQMPLMDGSRLTHFIKQMSPDSTVILLTGSDSEALSQSVESGSFDRVLFKPPNLEDFRRVVLGALGPRHRNQGVVEAL